LTASGRGGQPDGHAPVGAVCICHWRVLRRSCRTSWPPC